MPVSPAPPNRANRRRFPELPTDAEKGTSGLMYGMVNQAIEQMVTEIHGEEAWEKIKEMAGIDVDVFISNEGYPDDYTYRLVAAASELSQTPAEEILEAFGEHWLLRSKSSPQIGPRRSPPVCAAESTGRAKFGCTRHHPRMPPAKFR